MYKWSRPPTSCVWVCSRAWDCLAEMWVPINCHTEINELGHFFHPAVPDIDERRVGVLRGSTICFIGIKIKYFKMEKWQCMWRAGTIDKISFWKCILKYFILMPMCVCAFVCTHLVDPYGGQKRSLEPLEMVLQAVVSHWCWGWTQVLSKSGKFS